MKRIDELFIVEYPKILIFQEAIPDANGVNYISSRGTNNGVVCRVRETLAYKEYPAGIITVPLKGTVLNAFLQPERCYVAHQIAVLICKTNMTENQLLYYCLCIRSNSFRYNYGRQADKTLRNILVPDVSDIPNWVISIKMPAYDNIDNSIHNDKVCIKKKKTRMFRYDELFIIKKGKRVTKLDLIPGDTPFLGAIAFNNGIREYAGLVALHQGNTITVNYNGSVGEAFYQENPFWASDDVNVLYPKFSLNKYIAMFIITIIKQEKYRFGYGRKWHKERMESSTMQLPVDFQGNPDWMYIEQYIKSLPYSAGI